MDAILAKLNERWLTLDAADAEAKGQHNSDMAMLLSKMDGTEKSLNAVKTQLVKARDDRALIKQRIDQLESGGNMVRIVKRKRSRGVIHTTTQVTYVSEHLEELMLRECNLFRKHWYAWKPSDDRCKDTILKVAQRLATETDWGVAKIESAIKASWHQKRRP